MRKSFSVFLLFTIVIISTFLCERAKAQKNPNNTAAIPAPRIYPGLPTPYSARAQKGNIDLVFFGDSITEGWWPHKELWKEYYGKMNAVNFGHGGDRVQTVHWRVLNGDADGYTAKVVVLMVGTCNGHENTVPQIVEGITLLVQSIREKQPKAKILLLGIPPANLNPPQKQSPKITQINVEIAKLKENDTIRFFDLHKVWLKEDGNTPIPGVFADSLHPTKLGYELWAKAMHPLLLEMMGAGSKKNTTNQGGILQKDKN